MVLIKFLLRHACSYSYLANAEVANSETCMIKHPNDIKYQHLSM